MYRGSAYNLLGRWVDANDHMYIENLAVDEKKCPPFCRAGHWLTQPVSMILWKKSVSLLDCNSILAERSSANRPPPAREGGPLEASPEAQKRRIFASFPIRIGAQNLYWPGVVAVISAEKNKKKSRKIRAPCGDDVTFLMLLVFARAGW